MELRLIEPHTRERGPPELALKTPKERPVAEELVSAVQHVRPKAHSDDRKCYDLDVNAWEQPIEALEEVGQYAAAKDRRSREEGALWDL